MMLELKRLEVSRSRKRPSRCKGCPANPSSPEFDPLMTGGFIPPSGSLNADLMIVGISGGEEEEVRGEPLVGPSGRKLLRALTCALDGRSLRIRKYNVFNCRSIKVGMQGKIINRTPPTAREMRACCERWLFPELAKFKGKLVLLLGTDVYKFLLKNRFDVFGKAMGHRLYVPRKATTDAGIGKLISSYNVEYETEH